jgi:hypothetical protein
MMSTAAARHASPLAGPAPIDCRSRALALWPGLDTQKLRRTHGEPERVARLVERRTRLPLEVIIAMLSRPAGEAPDA